MTVNFHNFQTEEEEYSNNIYYEINFVAMKQSIVNLYNIRYQISMQIVFTKYFSEEGFTQI